MWPSRTREQAVSLFRSSALDIFRVSLRKRLPQEKTLKAGYEKTASKTHVCTIGDGEGFKRTA